MTLSELEFLGFDSSESDGEGYLRVRCSRCEALVINGTPCHERGCSNKSHECRECGCSIPAGESCDCMEPCEDSFGDDGSYSLFVGSDL